MSPQCQQPPACAVPMGTVTPQAGGNSHQPGPGATEVPAVQTSVCSPRCLTALTTHRTAPGQWQHRARGGSELLHRVGNGSVPPPRGVTAPSAALLAHRLPPRFALQGKMIFLTADRCAAPPSASPAPTNHDPCRQRSPARVGTAASHRHKVGIFIFPGFWQSSQAASARWGTQNRKASSQKPCTKHRDILRRAAALRRASPGGSSPPLAPQAASCRPICS